MWRTDSLEKTMMLGKIEHRRRRGRQRMRWLEGITNSKFELAQTHVHPVVDDIQPSYPLSSPSPPAFNHSQHQGIFQWVGSSRQVAKVLEFQLQHQSCQWIFRLISFRMDWLDLLAVQGTLKSFLQHHSSKASILRCSAFFIVQLSHPYMSTGKTIALSRRMFVGTIMCLLFSNYIQIKIKKNSTKSYL